MDLLFLAILIIVIVILSKKEEKKIYLDKLEENKQFKIKCSKHANRQILNIHGDEGFIKAYGQDQYDMIKNNTDTEVVKIIKNSYGGFKYE